jgi:hypothetical protein
MKMMLLWVGLLKRSWYAYCKRGAAERGGAVRCLSEMFYRFVSDLRYDARRCLNLSRWLRINTEIQFMVGDSFDGRKSDVVISHLSIDLTSEGACS